MVMSLVPYTRPVELGNISCNSCYLRADSFITKLGFKRLHPWIHAAIAFVVPREGKGWRCEFGSKLWICSGGRVIGFIIQTPEDITTC